ncbi:hypothetical protein PGT21_011386, partial [Puccinia graminis f. sp. tritici]
RFRVKRLRVAARKFGIVVSDTCSDTHQLECDSFQTLSPNHSLILIIISITLQKPKSKTKQSSSFDQELPLHRRPPTQNSLDAPPPLEIRLFRLPFYLTNPKLFELISVFPNFIKVRIKSIKVFVAVKEDGLLGTTQPDRPFGCSVFEKDLGGKGSFIERIKMFFFRFFKL